MNDEPYTEIIDRSTLNAAPSSNIFVIYQKEDNLFHYVWTALGPVFSKLVLL